MLRDPSTHSVSYTSFQILRHLRCSSPCAGPDVLLLFVPKWEVAKRITPFVLTWVGISREKITSCQAVMVEAHLL